MDPLGSGHQTWQVEFLYTGRMIDGGCSSTPGLIAKYDKNTDHQFHTITIIWLVVEPPTPLKNDGVDGVSSSVGMMFHSQLFLESLMKFMFQTTHQTLFTIIYHHLPEYYWSLITYNWFQSPPTSHQLSPAESPGIFPGDPPTTKNSSARCRDKLQPGARWVLNRGSMDPERC